MQQDLSTIRVGKGLGTLIFGMTRQQVKTLLGEPDEIDKFYLDDEQKCESESWYFDQLGISLSFDAEENWKLITIEVDKGRILFNEKAVLNEPKESLYELLKNMNISDLKEESTALTEINESTLISSDELGINFWLEDNYVTEVQWSPLFDTNDEIIWPTA